MSSNGRSVLLLFLCSISFFVTNCAFGTRNVMLNYPPQKANVSSIPNTVEAAVNPNSNTKSITLLQFSDQRSDKRVIGEVRNGWGMRTADVVADNSVSEWITNAVRMELEKSGYKVMTVKHINSTTTDPVVGGDIINVYCIALFAYEGEVSFFAYLQKDGKEILKKRYTGKGSSGMNWAATSTGYGDSLTDALAVAVRNFVDDLETIVVESKI